MADASAPAAGLLRNIALLAIVIAIQALVAIVSLQALSILRFYVQAESLWSESLKTATIVLDDYLDHGDERNYQDFLAATAIAVDERAARRALEDASPDVAASAAALQRAGLNPSDFAGAIFGYLHFREFGILGRAIAIWKQTDPVLTEFVTVGEVIHAKIRSGIRPADADTLKDEVHAIDVRLSRLGEAFSKILRAEMRDVTRLVTFANIGLAFVLIALVAWRMRYLFRRSQRFEDALRNEKEQAQITLQAIGDAVIRIDAAGRVRYANPAAERLLGQDLAAARGRQLSSVVAFADETGLQCDCPIESMIAGRSTNCSPGSGLVLETAGGSTPVSLQGAPFVVDGETKGTVLVLRDMTRERDLIGRLSWQAGHDELTGLANRRALDRSLNGRIARPFDAATEDALLLFDLDQFKLVNDTYGHAAGDQVLREVAALLKLELPDDSLPVRLGGDEFAAFLPDCDAVQAMEIAERLRDGIQSLSFSFGGRPVRTSASIGLVANTRAIANVEDVLSRADMACYLAKEKGRNRVQRHEPTDLQLLKRIGEMGWAHTIRDALNEDRLCFYAQRIEPLQGQPDDTHLELLIRLRDGQGALAPPGSFIPAAERFGLMPRIDRWVVEAAFASLADLTAATAGCAPVTFAINLSGLSLGDSTFIDFVRERFVASRIEPSSICFEITETAAIANLEMATKFIETFRAIGCQFSLDDFGSGMSSFGYLKRLPVDYLKIDGAFVKDMLIDPMDRAMVDTIARMARTLGKRTIAEFAETIGIVDALRTLGVDYAQGYGIGRPVPLCDEIGRAKARCRSAGCLAPERDREPAVKRFA